MSGAPSGSLATALAHARRLLERDPALAAEQARAILEAAPGHPEAELHLATALRLGGDVTGALAILAPLAAAQPGAAAVYHAHAAALAEAGRGAEALAVAARARSRWTAAARGAGGDLADLLDAAGEGDAAETARLRHVAASAGDPGLIEAATALLDDRIAVAEGLLRAHLKAHPRDVAALRMLAEAGRGWGALWRCRGAAGACAGAGAGVRRGAA